MYVVVCAGLGLYEYMLLVEELGAEPIWVLNNGLSHEESVPTAQIQPLVQDALDSIEFIMGSQDSTWGSLRARMGHPKPWKLTYIGIGNEVITPPYGTVPLGLWSNLYSVMPRVGLKAGNTCWSLVCFLG